MNFQKQLLFLFLLATVTANAQTLNEAIQKKDTVLASKLISQGSDPNQKDENGTTLLMTASRFSEVDIARFLINHGATINQPRSPKGRTNLMVACAYYSGINMVQLLVEKGADVNLTADDGSTALMLASAFEKLDVVNFLLAHGANASMKDKAGKTALDFAASGKVEDRMKTSIKDSRIDKEKTIESLKAAMK
jgi:ankyrin repeat protein